MNVMQLLLKRYRRRVNKVIKGGNVLSILFAFTFSLVIPPFNIFASTQTIIVPTYSSSSTESTWSSHLHVENYCEGTNASTNSCILKFTVDDNYYGMISFDAYNGNTKWIDYQNVFIAGGYGEYHYNFWSNGQIVMNRVNINAVSLVLPDSNVDLTQIIQLLTAIESDTNAIESYTSQTLNQIRSVLSQLIISNGYLEKLTKLTQWHFPIESLGLVYSCLLNSEPVYTSTYYNYDYPLFKYENGDLIFTNYFNRNIPFKLIFICDRNVWGESVFRSYFDFSENYEILNYNVMSNLSAPFVNNSLTYLLSVELQFSTNGFKQFSCTVSSGLVYILPIYLGRSDNKYISTDFALRYGLSNQLLDNLGIIASGTSQSNQSSSNLETQKGTFDTTSNNLYTSENAFNTDMNSKLQNIDTSFDPTNAFGSRFLQSADWVRTQFNNLTSTSPFGTVLSFSMLLGLSLLIIGKVFK